MDRTVVDEGGRQQVLTLLHRVSWIAALALVGIAVTVALLHLAHRGSKRWVLHSREVARLAREARALATDRETGIRGYLLSRDSLSLAPEFTARPRLTVALDSLRELTRDNPAQQRRAEAVRDALGRWDNAFAAPALRQAQRTDPLAGKALFDSVRAALAAFTAAEDSLYSTRVRRDALLTSATLATVLLEVLVLGAILLWLWRRLMTQTRRLFAQQEQLEAQATQLEEQAVELEQQMQRTQAMAEELAVSNRELSQALSLAERASWEKEETSSLLDLVMTSAPVGFAFLDREYRYVRVNGALAALNGYRPEEHIGRSVRELLPASAPAIEPQLQRVLESGEPLLGI